MAYKFKVFGVEINVPSVADLKKYLPLTGGTVSGVLDVSDVFRANYYINIIGNNRFNGEWLGFYPSFEEAKNLTNRKGWIGHNSSDHFQIKNEVDNGRIRMLSNSAYYLDYYGHKYDDNWTSGWFKPGQAGTALGASSERWYRVYSANSDSVSSDRRLKHDILYIADLPVTFSDGANTLERIFNNLKPSTYIMNADAKERLRIGFVAQDVAEALEAEGFTEDAFDLVNHAFWTDEKTGEEKDEYGLVYEQFIALNTHMIQKQQKEIDELKKQIEELTKLVKGA